MYGALIKMCKKKLRSILGAGRTAYLTNVFVFGQLILLLIINLSILYLLFKLMPSIKAQEQIIKYYKC